MPLRSVVASGSERHGSGGPSGLQNRQGVAAPRLEGSIPSPLRRAQSGAGVALFRGRDARTIGPVVVPAGASCLSDGPVTVRGGVFVAPGATFVLGSEDNPVDTGTISGGVRADHPASVQIHFTRINGGIDVRGGSGPFGGPFEVTFNAIEDN